jgi:hypothetical protein
MGARVRTVVAGLSVLASMLAMLVGGGVADASATVEWVPPRLIDNMAPFGHAPRFTDLACPSVSFCAGVDYEGEVAVSSDPVASEPSWAAARLFGYGLERVSCPEAGKCLVVGPSATLWTTSDAAAAPASWRSTSFAQAEAPGLSDVSCASVRMCAVTEIYYSHNVRTVEALISVDPFSAEPHWTAAPIASQFFYPSRIQCPTEQRCIATDGRSTMILSIDSSGDGTWTLGLGWPTVGEPSMTGWSCPTASFCLAVDSKGDATAWRDSESSGNSSGVTQSDVDPLRLTDVSCASESFCLAVDEAGNVVSSNDPAAATPIWSAPLTVDPQAGSILPGGEPVMAEGLEGFNAGHSPTVACTAAEQCVALDTYGNELIGGPPITQSTGWRRAIALAPQDGIGAIACPSSHQCAAIDDASRLISTRTPASGSSTWAAATIPNLGDSYFPWGIACSGRPLCVAWDRSYKCCGAQAQQMVASVHPDGGGATWRPITGGAYFGGLIESEAKSCPWRGICLIYRYHRGAPPGVIVVETKAGRHHHHRPQQFIPLEATSCPAVNFCFSVAVDGEEPITATKSGLVQVSTAPASGRWGTHRVGPRPLDGISCPSSRLCFAFDENGDVLWSRSPRKGAWREAHVSASPLQTLVCPSASLCVGINSANEVVWSTAPLGGASTWKSQLLETDGRLTSVACPTSRTCLVGDTAGRLILGVAHGR